MDGTAGHPRLPSHMLGGLIEPIPTKDTNLIESKTRSVLNSGRRVREIKRLLRIFARHPALAMALSRRRTKIVAVDDEVLPWLRQRERRREPRLRKTVAVDLYLA
jgi:hypothetical protein